MTSPLDIIPVPGHPGMFNRRVAVEKWQAAGSPDLTYAGRLYVEQKRLYDGWHAHLPGFDPADNPDDPTQPLAHVRFVAFDVKNPNPAKLRAGGLVCPYKAEPWHWQLPGDVRRFALVTSIPAAASTGPTPSPTTPSIPEEDDMAIAILEIKGNSAAAKSLYDPRSGRAIRVISKDENSSFRAASAGSVVYVSVSAAEYKQRGGF